MDNNLYNPRRDAGWEWRLWAKDNDTSIWLRIQFTDEITTLLISLGVVFNVRLGILYFESAADISYFRIKTGL